VRNDSRHTRRDHADPCLDTAGWTGVGTMIVLGGILGGLYGTFLTYLGYSYKTWQFWVFMVFAGCFMTIGALG